MLLNDLALEDDLGLQLLSPLDGWLDAPERSYDSAALTGRAGGAPVLGAVGFTAKQLTFAVQKDAGSMTGSRDGLGALYQTLDGPVEVVTIDAPNRMLYAYFQKAKGSVFSLPLVTSDDQAAVTLIAPNPLWCDRTPVSTVLPAGVLVPIPGGTAPANYTVWIGPGVNPIFTLYDSRGLMTAQMRFDGNGGLTLAANEFLRLETREGLKIKRVTAGVESAAYNYLNAADTFFPLDPNDSGYVSLTNASGMLGTWRGYKS